MFNRNHLILFVIFLIIFDFFVWSQIVSGVNEQNNDLEVYFLDVGQGDSELINLPNDVQVLMDGGPDNKILEELSSILPPTDRYIDLVVLSHPQYDHFAGLIEVLKRYEIGAFLYNGREGTAKAFEDLKRTIEKNKIPTIILTQGDKIKYQNNLLDILSPTADLLKSKELNDTSLVISLAIELVNQNFSKLHYVDDRQRNVITKILFTGDIGFKVENYLTENFNIDSDVLKVGHHGSKYSSGKKFLKAVNPKIAIIEVGKNTYGHPTSQTLNGLASIGSQIFRTDQSGTIKLVINGEKINIFKKK